MGLTVTVCFLDIDEKETYKIVVSFEADPLNGLLSNETPLAAAIMGHKVGDTVEVNAAKPYKVTILEIVSK
jgi:transcription elongation factor GreA